MVNAVLFFFWKYSVMKCVLPDKEEKYYKDKLQREMLYEHFSFIAPQIQVLQADFSVGNWEGFRETEVV